MTELNEKLAVWAGFTRAEIAGKSGYHLRGGKRIPDWIQPDGSTCYGRYDKGILPNFIYSLDACFKWLVPRFEQVYLKYYTPETGPKLCSCIGHTAVVFMGNWTNRGEGTDKDSMALALCRAIEQVIDGVAQ